MTWQPLESEEILHWLNAVTLQLSQAAPAGLREEMLAELRRDSENQRATFRVLASLALLDDCLRVANLAIDADGKVDDDELASALPLARVAVPRFFSLLPQYEAFGDPDLGAADLVEFLRVHRQGRAPFGDPGAGTYRGVSLCKRIAAQTGNHTLLRDLERMLVSVMNAVFADRNSSVEEAARAKLRGLIDTPITSGEDSRTVAFCRPDGPNVFSSVAYGPQIFERDPFDVETIHGDARAVFESQLERAISRDQVHVGHGRTLLMLGGGGSGKTHLLRAFRTSVHGRGLGYVGYLQMSSDVGDYTRYVLIKLVDSLERPYDAPERNEPGLNYLSDNLVEHGGLIPAAQIERLRSGELSADELPSFIGKLVDRLVRSQALHDVETDLIHALLLLQRRDPALQRRIIKFLRCEELTAHESALLGGLAARSQREDPARTIVQLGKLAFELQSAALVLLIDQIEDAIPDAAGHERIQRAIDAVRGVTDALPSSLAVIACLDDVYDEIRSRLNQTSIDRLERDPAPVRLSARRGRTEIEAMLTLRLEYLYDSADVAWREDDPLFPFRPSQLDELSGSRARDCLASFRKYQESCIAEARLLTTVDGIVVDSDRVEEPQPRRFDELDRVWNDALVADTPIPDEEPELLALVGRGVQASASELATVVKTTFTDERLKIAQKERKTRVVAICNNPNQGGHLGRQIEALREAVGKREIAIALRTSEFSLKPKTKISQQVGELIKAGGLALSAEVGDLRAIAAFDAFLQAHGGHPAFEAWRSERKPLASLSLCRKLLDLESVQIEEKPVPPPVMHTNPPPPPEPKQVASPPSPSQLRLGVTLTMRGEAITMDRETLKVHAAFLGTTGSGKTTIALNIVEQLLEQGISVVLMDRKGDLARYASKAWWDEVPADGEAARRKRALRERVHVDLFTPGESGGRPVRIPIIPAGMSEMTTQERDQVASAAASGLAAMMGYGNGDSHKKRTAILKKAIELHADAVGTTLDDLRDTISRPDPDLLAAVGNLTRHFSAVAEDLDTLAIQRGQLLAGGGEALDTQAMLTPHGKKTRLTIISAVVLNDVAVLQFFVSRLLVELGRTVRRNPHPTLRAVALFDEADIYIPALGSPPTKEPMFELLRRARAGGLGVFLGTQNPGDIDYKARDNISTWLVGRIAQARAIEKMRNLLGAYPNVAVRLAGQATGSFFLINPTLSTLPRELRADMALMKTEQLQEDEIAAMARATGP